VDLFFIDSYILEMEQITTTSSVYVPHPKYDLSRGEGDLQRYFIYKTIEEDGVKKLKGECRKCGKLLSRIDGATTSMVNHEETCDNEAWKIYKAAPKSRKSISAPSTPKSTLQPTIDSKFMVNQS